MLCWTSVVTAPVKLTVLKIRLPPLNVIPDVADKFIDDVPALNVKLADVAKLNAPVRFTVLEPKLIVRTFVFDDVTLSPVIE